MSFLWCAGQWFFCAEPRKKPALMLQSPGGAGPVMAGIPERTMTSDRLRENWDAVRSRIASAAGRAGRAPDEVTLVAVTKLSTPEQARRLVELGAIDLGENYPQELWRKAESL